MTQSALNFSPEFVSSHVQNYTIILLWRFIIILVWRFAGDISYSYGHLNPCLPLGGTVWDGVCGLAFLGDVCQ